MGPFDIPEVPIVLGLLGSLNLAAYKWMHRSADAAERH
jgi:hypothetical protein